MKPSVLWLGLGVGLLLAGCAARGGIWRAPAPQALASAPAVAPAFPSTCCEWNDAGQLACGPIAEAKGSTRPGALRCEGAQLIGSGVSIN